MSVQRLSQTSESVADVEVVGTVVLPRHLVGSAEEEEVPSELTVMTCGELHVLVPVALANLRATKRECRFRVVFEGSYIRLQDWILTACQLHTTSLQDDQPLSSRKCTFLTVFHT